MFSRLATLLPIAALVAVASAAPGAVEARDGGSCSSGGNYCCNQVLTGPTLLNGVLGGLLNVIAGVNAGLTCDPITVIGVSGTSCTVQTACCINNEENGLINIECNPVNVNL